jgi:hypothetical protein
LREGHALCVLALEKTTRAEGVAYRGEEERWYRERKRAQGGVLIFIFYFKTVLFYFYFKTVLKTFVQSK